MDTDKSQENHLRTSASSADVTGAFLASLALSTLPAADLFALYQAWIDRLAGLEAELAELKTFLKLSADDADKHR